MLLLTYTFFGRATSTMEFSHYAETPSNISEGVIAEVKGNKA